MTAYGQDVVCACHAAVKQNRPDKALMIAVRQMYLGSTRLREMNRQLVTRIMATCLGNKLYRTVSPEEVGAVLDFLVSLGQIPSASAALVVVA